MAPRFLVSADIDQQVGGQASLDWKTLSYLNNVVLTTDSSRNDAVLRFIQTNLRHASFYVNVTGLQDDLESVTTLLNHGVAKVFVSTEQYETIVRDGLVDDYCRLIISAANQTEFAKIATQLQSDTASSVDIHFQYTGHIQSLQAARVAFAGQLQDPNTSVFVDLPNATELGYQEFVEARFVPIVASRRLTNSSTDAAERIPVPALFTTLLISDRPDGLYTTVVTDERGTCLGLVYSNGQSLEEAIKSGKGVYHSRKRGLWRKGESSGDTQELIRIDVDCDSDALLFVVTQNGRGFCHLQTATCFGPYSGLSKLEKTLQDRKLAAPKGSYSARLFSDDKLLRAKILEEADELVQAQTKEDVAAEAADVLYFLLAKCIRDGVNLADIEANLDLKSRKVVRRKGDAKPQFANRVGLAASQDGKPSQETLKEAASVPKAPEDPAGFRDGRIRMRRLCTSDETSAAIKQALQRPSQKATDQIFSIARPIIDEVRTGGDAAVLKYTHKFDKATSLTTPVLKAPFPPELMQLSSETAAAIDVAYENIRAFHAAQAESGPLQVETMPGVTCSRHVRPIASVGLYVPGGTAVLPSTALMLGVPASVANCSTIVLASPPRSDGTLTPEIVYAAHKVGASAIVLAGGAQAIAALAYGTESIPKVDKILGPGNAFVTAAKMIVSNDTNAKVSIDMPAGPSEVLVIADETAKPAFIAADLLSQAEHGADSQVVLIAIDLNEQKLKEIEDEVHRQAMALPRVDIVRGAIEHSVTFVVKDREEALALSNDYAPEHLILQVRDAEQLVPRVLNAGSIFIGHWTPESVGDYAAGVNHSLPTYGYARQYSGVSLSSFTKHITASSLTEQGLANVGPAVMQLAKVEELEAHRRAVSIRLGLS